MSPKPDSEKRAAQINQIPALRRRFGMSFVASEQAEQVGPTLKRIWSYVARERMMLIVLAIVVVVGTAANMYAPALQSRCIDIIAGTDEHDLHHTLFLMLSGYAIYCFCQAVQGILSARLSQRLVGRLRSELFSKVIDLPISYLDRRSHGDVMSCMTNDIENISLSVSQAWATLCSGLLTIIASSVIMLVYSWQLAFLSVFAGILTVIGTRAVARLVHRHARHRQQLLGELNGMIEENIYGYHTVVAYAREEEMVETFNEEADELTTAGIRMEIFSGLMGPVMFVTRNLNFIIIAAFGGYFVVKGLITVGTISAFIVYSKMFSRPINEIAQIYGQLQTAVAGAERVFNIMDERSESLDGPQLQIKKREEIVFENVNFSYIPGEPVIRDFNLRIPAGKKVALVGATGSGKTTIASLLLRFYDLDSGRILVNGQNIARVGRSNLRRCMAVVMQETQLFSDTVEHNLCYGHSDNWRSEAAKENSLQRAVKMSCAQDVLDTLSEGFDTVLEGAGAALSHGQRQLLAIARAFLADPQILILDEATSNVDTRTEKNIQYSMSRLMQRRTCLVIAHRLSTIRDADIIIVMDAGRIAEQGTHESLLELKGKYYELYKTQFAGIAT